MIAPARQSMFFSTFSKMLQAAIPSSPCEAIQTAGPAVEVCHAHRDIDPHLWEASFGAHAKDGRFYQIVEDCLSEQFRFLYITIRGADGMRCAVQPALVVDQDGAAGLPKSGRKIIDSIRKLFPRFLRMKLLMVGCAAGEGIPGTIDRAALDSLRKALPGIARNAGASIIVLKDLPAEYRAAVSPVFTGEYRRVPGLPAAVLDLTGYSSFEDYLQNRVGKVFRKNLRRKFRKLDGAPPIAMEVITDASHLIDTLFPLYWQTYQRAELEFEVLNREFFQRLGRDMPDKTRFFIWRQAGRIIAFNLCLVHDGVIYDLDLGMDYSVALDLHMYFVTWRDIVQWSIDNGLRQYHTGPLNYDPKLHLKLRLSPQDLYARHISKLINPFFKIAMGFMHPVRHNPILRKFENAREME
jgi:hypothetical protein